MTDKPRAIHLQSVNGDIKFHDVTFRYNDGMPPVADGVNLHIRPGEIIAFIGPSGGGKTTLAKLLLRLYHPQKGIELNSSKIMSRFCINPCICLRLLPKAQDFTLPFSWSFKLYSFLYHGFNSVSL